MWVPLTRPFCPATAGSAGCRVGVATARRLGAPARATPGSATRTTAAAATVLPLAPRGSGATRRRAPDPARRRAPMARTVVGGPSRLGLGGALMMGDHLAWCGRASVTTAPDSPARAVRPARCR